MIIQKTLKDLKQGCKDLSIDYEKTLQTIVTDYLNQNSIFKEYFSNKIKLETTVLRSYVEDNKAALTIQKELNLSQQQIFKILNNHKVKRSRRQKTPNFDIHYFEDINTNEKAYFLGLLLADGNVNEKRKSVRIGLQEGDSYILEEFKKAIKSPNEVYFCHKPNKYPTRQHKRVLEITSIKFYNDLNKLGMVPRKSLIIKYPSINKIFEKDLIRGLLDGDGCIYIGKDKKNYNQYRVSWLGTKDLCEGIHKYFSNKNIKLSIHKKENIYSTGTSKKEDIIKICDLLYKDTNLYLTRKYDKYMLIKTN